MGINTVLPEDETGVRHVLCKAPVQAVRPGTVLPAGPHCLLPRQEDLGLPPCRHCLSQVQTQTQ